MRKLAKDQFNNILDCMTGADGAIRFMKLRTLLDRMDAEAAEGNEDSAEVLCVLSMFSKLIDYASTEEWKPPDPLDPPFEFEPEEDDGSDEVLGEEKQT